MIRDALALLVLGVFALLLPLSSAYRASMTRQFAGWAAAHVPAEQEANLERRLTRRAQGVGAGILAAGVLALVLALVWGGADETSGVLFVLSSVFALGAAGLLLADVLWPGDVASGPRAARATTPTLADYLPPASRLVARVFVAVGVLALVGTLLLGLTRWFDAATLLRSPVPLLAVAVPVLAGLTWLASRRLLDAPQPARDEHELYWQDAVRARTLNSLHAVAPVVGMFGLLVCGSVLDAAASATAVASGQVGPGWSLWLLIAGYLLPVVLIVAALPVVSGAGRREVEHFRARLWPDHPAGGPQPSAAGTSTSSADGRA